MAGEETNKQKDKTKSEGSGPAGSGMFEMMSKCCTGVGSFSGCSAMMKGMMETMKNPSCCTSKTKNAESEEGGK